MTQRDRPEANVERGQICPFYGGLGIEVYPTSSRVHPIGVRPGVADLICFFPRLGFHFFHETKVLPRRQTKEQWEFEQHCIATNVPYVLGGIDEAMAFVVFLEIATPVGPTVRFKPRNEWPGPESFADIGNEWSFTAARADAIKRFGYKKAA